MPQQHTCNRNVHRNNIPPSLINAMVDAMILWKWHIVSGVPRIPGGLGMCVGEALLFYPPMHKSLGTRFLNHHMKRDQHPMMYSDS